MKKSILHLLSALLFLFSAMSLHAQAVRNTAERFSDHRQIQVDKATIERDQQELREFRRDLASLGDAVENEQAVRAREYHSRLLQSMEREIAQGSQKIELADREVGGSKSELRSSRRELRGDRATNQPLRAADDRRDKRDDRRDLRDDKSDLEELRMRNARQREILDDIRSVNVKREANVCRALRTKRNLMQEFEQSMVRDMGENVEELREDKGELREDRRETREDRRQR